MSDEKIIRGKNYVKMKDGDIIQKGCMIIPEKTSTIIEVNNSYTFGKRVVDIKDDSIIKVHFYKPLF